MSFPEEIKAEYASSLADLTFNSKPLINVLTMLAEENLPNAKVIVEAIEEHLAKVHTDVKLPILYLIDCIVKTVGGTYMSLFSQNIVTTFIGVFKTVEEKTRAEMFKLRQTWNDVFPQMKLYAIDVQINLLDPAWPVTAKPPSNSIHLNPKFLKSTPTSTAQTPKQEDVPSPVVPGAPAVDKQTLIMQEKLIQKQKELLELQQKRLELEVLQTQVKLQEQIKQNLPKTGRPQNILLKPEVAKQLAPFLQQHKPDGMNTAISRPEQQTQNTTSAPTNGTKINPVSSALINAKPIRDPRLMKQQQQNQQESEGSPSNGNAVNQLHQRTALLENNKIVTNKGSVRKSRNDPRLINKDSTSSQKSDIVKPNNSSKFRNSDPTTHKSHKSSRSSSQKGSDAMSAKTNSSATVSLDTPKVTSDVNSVRQKNKEKSEDKRQVFPKEKREKSGKDSPINSGAIKIKSSMKNRNYVRKNLGSASRDVVEDVDLRSFGPPEKQPRLQGDPTEDTIPVPAPSQIVQSPNPPKGMDVDLRQLPPVANKKRSSSDNSEVVVAKKNKSEILDKLFGDEDTDLRQLAMNSEPRPKTPPPPIISASNKDDVPVSPKADSPKSNLDAVRAKLANATNRDKVLSKSYNKKKSKLADQDLRHLISTSPQLSNKIIITPEDENNIKSGKMTNEESSKLLNKIILQMEKHKLKEAKRKDHEESFNVSLQPISDEEFNDSDFEEEKDSTEKLQVVSIPKENAHAPTPICEESIIPFNDKDERLITGPLPPKGDFAPESFFSREVNRFSAPYWRGNRGSRRNWEPRQPRMPVRPWNTNIWMTQPFVPPNRDFEEEIPPALEEKEPLTSGFVNVDEIKSMAIDGVSRDIRFYGETAIVFIGWDDPRELTFQNDGVRTITFNDTDSYVLPFNDDYKEVMCNGNPHIVRIGSPSREIFIDGVPYQCYFGSPGISIELDEVPTKVQLEGPPPPVNIGKVKRTDLVAGKINMFINAKVIVPVFLDAKVQKFVLYGETSTLKFVDALNTVLINDIPFNVEYGGLPKPLFIHGKKHFIRFSVLPKGVKPGKVKIVDMEGVGDSSPLMDENSQDTNASDAYDPGMPIAGMLDKPVAGSRDSPERNTNSPNFYQNLLQQQHNNLDALSNVVAPPLGPSPETVAYQVDNNRNSPDTLQNSQLPASLPGPALNINDLFQRLVASGFVTSDSAPKTNVEEDSKAKEFPSNVPKTHPVIPATSSSLSIPTKTKKTNILSLKPVTFERPETLRVRQNSLYSILYSGMQCSTCGMRFSPEASMLYSQHLDWHFRQNRKGKKNSRVATSRIWYYSLSDWKNYEELEDLEEREKNYFDELKQADAGEDAVEDVEIPTVAADPSSTDECCEVCNDKFEQFFHEENEEWHLKNAIKADDKTYHPLCYEDYQESLLREPIVETVIVPEEKDKPPEESIIPGLEIIIDDDDEDDIPEKSSIPEVVSVDVEEEEPTPKVTEDPEEPQQEEDDGDDDDVILNEEAPIKIIVDDDDDDEIHQDSNVPAEKLDADDDGFVEIAGVVSLPNGKHVKIKAEPEDKELDNPSAPSPSEDLLHLEPEDLEIMEHVPLKQDVVSSMDGNVETTSRISPVTISSISGNRIKINISKPLTVINKEKEPIQNEIPSETYIDPFEPFPPGEEPEPSTLKPALKTIRLTKLPPIRKDSELTGLCSLM